MSASPAAEKLSQASRLQQSGEPRAALAAYREALALGAAALEANLQLGVIHASLGEHAAAAEHLRKVLAEDPRREDALCMLGTVMYDGGRFDEAAGFFEQALAVRPAFPEARFNLGLARFERADLAGARECFAACFAQNRGAPWTADPALGLGAAPGPALAPRDMGVNGPKLQHDCEQLDYLLSLGRLPAAYRDVLQDYRSLLAELPAPDDPGLLVPFDPARHPLVAKTYKRPIHVDAGEPPAGPLISPELDVGEIERRYQDAAPNVAAIDGLLTPQALQALRRFCRESTIWNHINTGYLGAYFYDGFSSPILLRLAHELRARLPGVIRGLPLLMMWGYKCDATLPALGLHADAAAVNVNFWITEDEANLEPAHGGLLVYTCQAPADWGFKKFNVGSKTVEDYLASQGAQPLVYPYRANRAVIFDSDLFHASDRPHFREGYLNRRINITLLYGLRSS